MAKSRKLRKRNTRSHYDSQNHIIYFIVGVAVILAVFFTLYNIVVAAASY